MSVRYSHTIQKLKNLTIPRLLHLRLLFFLSNRFLGHTFFISKRKVLIKNNRAIILWTGGKDCNLALYEAHLMGFNVVGLLTFYKNNNIPDLEPLRQQALSLGIPITVLDVARYTSRDYVLRLKAIAEDYNAKTVITGTHSAQNATIFWLRKIIKRAKLNLFCPLWHRNKYKLLTRLLDLKFRIKFIYADHSIFENLTGQELKTETINEFVQISQKRKFDICGENNEYDTLVMDGPDYKNAID